MLKIFFYCSQDLFVAQSVTQVTNLLWSDERILNDCESSLLYRHLSVLRTLILNLEDVKCKMGASFSEEFR